MRTRPFVSVPQILILLLAFVFIGSGCTNQSANPETESVYDRVIDTGKIRVGYVTYPPGSIKDPNTGELSGVFVEALEEAGRNLSLEIEWTEEVGWGTMIEGLQANRYDMVGSQVWANSSRARHADFSIPLFYSGIGAYVRNNDTRFNGSEESLESLNDENTKIATIDGEMSDIIARTQFPNAQVISLTQLSDVSQLFLEVAQGRADVTFQEPYLADLFLQNNPGTIKNIVPGNPIRVFPNTMMFRKGEVEFKSMLDTALEELINQGYIDELLDKYASTPGAFYRVDYPYRLTSR